MFSNAKEQVGEKVKEQVQKHILNIKNDQTCSATFKTEYRTAVTAYRHMIKDLLEKFPSKDATDYRIFLELSTDEFDRLNQFASKSDYEHKDVLHEVHMISDLLKRVVYKVEADKSINNDITWSIWFRSFDINQITKSILVMIAIGIISFLCIRTHLRRGRWLTTIIIVAFVLSVVQNWYTLYQEAQAKIDQVLMKKIPKHCQGHSMGTWDYLKSYVGRFFQLPTDECLEYYKALRATPHSQVTPVQAVSMTLAQLFVTPLGAIGESLSQFFAGTMRHVPIAVWPIIIVLILIIVIILILMCSRYEVHLPFMMGSLRPSPHVAIPTQSTAAIADVEKLENRIKELEIQLEQKNLALDCNATLSTHASRSSSFENQSPKRARSLSIRRVQNESNDEDQRQQTCIGFKKDFLPD